jgi:hypothetical protein
LLSQVPPIPSVVNRPLSSTPTNNTRHYARSAIADPETIPFPDDLSDFPMNHGLDEDIPPDPSETTVHSVPALRPLFQIPSEIKEFALNLNLLSAGGNDSEDEYEEEFNHPIFAGPPESLAVAPLAADPISGNIGCNSAESTHLKKGYVLGHVHPIAFHEDFDMLASFPGSLVSMTRILHYCRKAALPLYFVDGILKIISAEASATVLTDAILTQSDTNGGSSDEDNQEEEEENVRFH